jgi:hypothetical protein
MPVSNLSAWQQFLSQKFPGKNASFTPDQLAAAADEFFGTIPIPPGAQVISRSGAGVEYVDADGYRHILRRELDGRSPNAGQVTTNTDRPNIAQTPAQTSGLLNSLTGGARGVVDQQFANALAQARGERPAAFDPGIQGYLDQITALAGQLQARPELAALDPETAAALAAINERDRLALSEQFDTESARNIAQLFGNRTQQSSIATNAVGQMLQKQGLVSAQQQAEAAQRELMLRQFLTGQQQQQRELALQGLLGGAGAQLQGFQASTGAAQNSTNALLDLLTALSGQQMQRDISSAQIGLGDRELEERRRQANLGFELDQQEADRRLAESNSLFNKIMQGLQVGGSLAGGIGGLIGGLGIGKPMPGRSVA